MKDHKIREGVCHMPVFDFKNSPEGSREPECTYQVFYTNESQASVEHPLLVLDNREGKLKHHSSGVFTNPIRRTAFELKDGDAAVYADILKIGLSLRDDFGAMRKRKEIKPANFLDLQAYVKQFGIEEASLQKIYAILFHKKISKGQRLTNWEADVLSDAQKKYAALDAWACLQIYNQLKNHINDRA